MNLLLMGIMKQDIICLCSCNNFHSCVPIICGFFLTVKVVCLDPTLSFDEMTHLLGEIKPKIIFASPDIVDLIDEAVKQVGKPCMIVVFGSSEDFSEFNTFLEPVEDESQFRPLPLRDLDEIAMILFSSDNVESAKGVCLSHCTFMVQTVNTVRRWNIGKELYLHNDSSKLDRNGFTIVLNFASYYWISAVRILMCCTITATTRVITSKFEASTVWKIIDKYNVSFMTCTTFEASQLYKIGKPEGVEGKSLRMLVTHGTSLSKTNLLELRKHFPRCFITNVYDQRELGGMILSFSFSKPGDIRDQYEKPSSCGQLMPGILCKIVDPINEKILGVNNAGELRYQADYTSNCYYNSHANVILDADGWIKTNDIAYYDEKRCFYVLDSYDDVFRYRCWHIVPSILENVVKLHPAVKEAVVIGIPREPLGDDEIPMGIVTLSKGMKHRVKDKDIEDFTNAILTKKQRLAAGLKIITNIPMTQTGKPMRKQIRNMILIGGL